MRLKETIIKIIKEELFLPSNILRRIESSDIEGVYRRYALDSYFSKAEKYIESGADLTARIILPWNGGDMNKWVDYLKMVDILEDFIYEKYGEKVRTFVEKVTQSFFKKDPYNYVWKGTISDEFSGLTETFNSWYDLLKDKCWRFDLDWPKIKNDLDNVKSGEIVVIKPKQPGDFYYTITKKVSKLNENKFIFEDNKIPPTILRRLASENFFKNLKKLTMTSIKNMDNDFDIDEVIEDAIITKAIELLDSYHSNLSNEEFQNLKNDLTKYIYDIHYKTLKRFLQNVFPEGVFQNDGNLYSLLRHTTLEGGQGIAKIFISWGDLVREYGDILPFDWSKIKERLDSTPAGKVVFNLSSDGVNTFYITIKKEKQNKVSINESKIPTKILRRIDFNNILNELKVFGISFSKYLDRPRLIIAIFADEYITGFSPDAYHSEIDSWVEEFSDFLYERYGEELKTYLGKVFNSKYYDEDEYQYAFKVTTGDYSTINYYDTWGQLIRARGHFFAIDWWEVKEKLDEISCGEIYLNIPDEKNMSNETFECRILKTLPNRNCNNYKKLEINL